MLSAQSVAQALVEHARQHNLSKLVLGHSEAARWWLGRPLGQAVGALAPDIDRIEVGQSQRSRPPPVPREKAVDAGAGIGAQLRPIPWAAAVCAATTLLTHLLVPYFDLANIVMVFLLSVVGVACGWAAGPAVLAAFFNVAAFDFFFVPPRLSFAVSDVQYLLTFAVMLVVGLVIGQLTAGLRFQAQRGHAPRGTLACAVRGGARPVQHADQRAGDRSGAGRHRARIPCPGGDLRARRCQGPAAAAPTDAAGLDFGTAQWALDHNQPAGLGTDTLAGSAWLYLPLKATMRSRGVLAVRPAEPRFLLVPEQRQQLETFAALAAMALERVHYIDVAQSATVQMESERLRNSLLAALSHDLRTPLAALVGMAETLVNSLPAADATAAGAGQRPSARRRCA